MLAWPVVPRMEYRDPSKNIWEPRKVSKIQELAHFWLISQSWKSVKIHIRGPIWWHAPQRPIPTYHTSLVSSLGALGLSKFKIGHNRIKVSILRPSKSSTFAKNAKMQKSQKIKVINGDFYTIMDKFEVCRPEGIQWANQRCIIRWYRALRCVATMGRAGAHSDSFVVIWRVLRCFRAHGTL